MLANDECEITDTYTYDAFGNLTESTGETENSFLYRGEQFDSFTGLYYLRARYMNPSTGTFITMDEYAGSIFEPVSLHKYLYANANPVMYSDPSGYLSVGELATTMAIQGIVSSIITAEIQLIHFFATAAPNQAFDWSSFWEAVIMGGIFGAGFGAVGIYAEAAKSVAIMTTLGFSSVGFAAISAIEAVSYGQQNEGELAATYWFLTAVGVTGAADCFGKAYKIQTARTTAKTTTSNFVENKYSAKSVSSKAKSNISNKPIPKTQTAKGEPFGSYTIEFDNGKTYHGKGPYSRMLQSVKQKEIQHKCKAVKTDWKPAVNEREAFIDEYFRIINDGGVENEMNYNKSNSPGRKYYQNDLRNLFK